MNWVSNNSIWLSCTWKFTKVDHGVYNSNQQHKQSSIIGSLLEQVPAYKQRNMISKRINMLLRTTLRFQINTNMRTSGKASNPLHQISCKNYMNTVCSVSAASSRNALLPTEAPAAPATVKERPFSSSESNWKSGKLDCTPCSEASTRSRRTRNCSLIWPVDAKHDNDFNYTELVSTYIVWNQQRNTKEHTWIFFQFLFLANEAKVCQWPLQMQIEQLICKRQFSCFRKMPNWTL